MSAICSTCRNPFNDAVVSIRCSHSPCEALTAIFVKPPVKEASTRMQTRSSSRKEFEENLFENTIKMCPNCDEMLAILYDRYKGFVNLIHPESDVGKKLGHLVSEEKKDDSPPTPPISPPCFTDESSISPLCFTEESLLPPPTAARKISVACRNGRPRKVGKTIIDDKSSSFTTFRDPTSTKKEKKAAKRQISPERCETPTHESPYVSLPDSPPSSGSQQKRQRPQPIDHHDEPDMLHDPYFNIPDCRIIPNQAILLPKLDWIEEQLIYDCGNVVVTKPEIPIEEGPDGPNVCNSDDDEEMTPVMSTRELFATEWYRNDYFIRKWKAAERRKMKEQSNSLPTNKDKFVQLMNVVVEEVDEGPLKEGRHDNSPVPSLCSDTLSEGVCDGDDEDSDCE
ncbi:uncharacterized protein LOC118434066 isoform X2 [Folsomia candida]|uniref:uncharacterized protein LOC118434066 isoform X2 n=1 Tax=Folsomia candida TaxID=158441 RepID=UPI001604B5D0|nr:uncharacterized protein LOC118434066 isoform X2 [Folsomia candida]